MNNQFLIRILISFAGALALSALIWFAAPLISIRDAHPLEETGPRLALIAAALALIVGVGLYRLDRRRKGAARIAEGLSSDDSDAPVLAERMKEALAVLRERGGRANYLYDLPWYVLIGPPGSGKTTALINSGLHFPLAGGVKPGAVKGVGGTRYCDWWFTEDAVLIDTAGRYTTQDSDARADEKSWLTFLNLLKRNRPRQPINGVLVAISLEDLLTLSSDEVAAHAAAIRARLIELHERLKVDFPVYAIFTKADLVIGFMEFFGDLDEAGRAQVFGATFQTMDKRKSMLGEAPEEFRALIEPLNRLAQTRLDETRDAATRVRAFGFPAQMAALQGPVTGFLQLVFDPARYRIDAALRGFYFTSGTQEGTPIDQLLGALAKGFGAQGVGAAAASGQGKSFFLTNLIKTVIIGEAGWVSTGRRRRLIKMAGFAALLIGGPLLIGALWIVHSNNLRHIGDLEDAARAYGSVSRDLGAADFVSDRDLAKVLPALHALRYLPGGYADAPDHSVGLGLSQSARLRSAAETAYGVGLERMLRPRLVYRLEEQIEASAGDPATLFDALKVYLMLGGLETVDRQLLAAWMERDWSETLYPGPKNSEGRKELEQHLAAMLDLESGGASFVQLNGPLVEKAQAVLARESVVDRALRIMATRAKATLRPDWSAAKAGGPGALIVFEPSIETVSVLYFFTRTGFEGFIRTLPATLEEMARDRWVLGPGGETPEVAGQYDHLRENLVDAYARNFVESWTQAINSLKMRKLTVERPSYPLLTAASSVTSPFIRLLESIRDETRLSTSEAAAPTQSASVEGESVVVVGSAGKTPAAMIEAELAPFQRLVEGDPGQRPIDRALSQLNDVRLNLGRLATGSGPAGEVAERIEAGVARLRTEAAGLPPPFSAMMSDAGADILREVTDSGVARTTAKLREQVTFTCQEKIAGRYPFAKDAVRDVEIEDFASMFGPKGLIDQFVSTYVLAFADTSGPEWKWRDDSPLAQQFASTALADFKLAADIRASFFGGVDPLSPGFSYVVTPPSISGVRLEIDATVISGGDRPATLQWPGSAEHHRVLLTMRSNAARPPMLLQSGPWSVYRLLETARLGADGTQAIFSLGGRDVSFRFVATPATPGASLKPFDLTALRGFHCPGGS